MLLVLQDGVVILLNFRAPWLIHLSIAILTCLTRIGFLKAQTLWITLGQGQTLTYVIVYQLQSPTETFLS